MSPSKFALTDLLPLPNSAVKIPRLGFGIYQSPTKVCINSCLTALRSGYRHIDSAQFYRNEAEMGEAARQSGMPRHELFLTTKILSAGGTPEATYKKCLDSVKTIDGDDGYVDLFLIHTPSGGSAARKEMWQALEKLESEGKVRSIGVSNFGVGHIEEMKSYARIWPPHVNQIEVCRRRLIPPLLFRSLLT
jgi:diketogulonate reductase-like aldo/keto reductase